MTQHTSTRNRRSRNAKARRRRMVGLLTSAGAFLAFGLTPLATAPPAHADEFDVIIDPIISAISGSLGGVVAPFAGVDLGGLGLGAADAASTSGLGLGSVDSGLAVPADALPALADPSVVASSADPLNTFFQGLEQDWINSSFGSQADSALNTWAAQADPAAVGDSCGLICNGADGTATDPNGGAGGSLFGDGGSGYSWTPADDPTGAPLTGGDGGDASYFGNGGDGGNGIDGGAGGAGGTGVPAGAGGFEGVGGPGGTGGAAGSPGGTAGSNGGYG